MARYRANERVKRIARLAVTIGGGMDRLFAIRTDYAMNACRVATPINRDNQSVVSQQGTAVFADDKIANEVFKSWIIDAGRLCDFLMTTMPRSLVVSKQVYQRFVDDFQLTFQALPIWFRKGFRLNRDYYYLVPRQRFDIVDYENAEIIYFDNVIDRRYARRVLTWVVDESKVPSFRIFSDQFGKTIVHQSMKEELEEGGSSGIVFIPLDSLREPLIGT